MDEDSGVNWADRRPIQGVGGAEHPGGLNASQLPPVPSDPGGFSVGLLCGSPPTVLQGSRGRGIKVESESGDDPTPRLARPDRKPTNRPAPDAPPDPALQSGQGLAS